MELNRYSEEIHSKLQTMRLSGIAGCALISAFALLIAILVPAKSPEEYRPELTLFFQVVCVVGFGAFFQFIFLWVINLQNGAPVERDKVQEMVFYARQNSDIALFLDDIREKEDRLPVIDEYVQILMFAHKKNLPIYHEYLKGREADAY